MFEWTEKLDEYKYLTDVHDKVFAISIARFSPQDLGAIVKEIRTEVASIR